MPCIGSTVLATGPPGKSLMCDSWWLWASKANYLQVAGVTCFLSKEEKVVGFCGDPVTSDGSFILSPQKTSSPDTPCNFFVLLSSLKLPFFPLFSSFSSVFLSAGMWVTGSYQTCLQDLLHLKRRRARGIFLRDYLKWQALWALSLPALCQSLPAVVRNHIWKVIVL